jgi:hypothetical protein
MLKEIAENSKKSESVISIGEDAAELENEGS